jgi:alpha-glutamyl/putrescinyl thymine pyrophosphorylase clade 1
MSGTSANGTRVSKQMPLAVLSSKTQEPACSPELLSLHPTLVFDAYWEFAAERQTIFCNRQSQSLPPWTTDPILSEFKFTNVYRASDRASQFLIRDVIYTGDDDPVEVIFRVLLFKLFNKIETWDLLQRELGPITTAGFSVERLSAVLNEAFEAGQRIYSGAYIMPAGAKTFNTARKHEAHLQLLEFMLKDKVSEKILAARSLKELFQILRSYPLIGDFLAFQYAIDINYSEVTHFSESEFVAAGPGARSGLRKCFGNLAGVSEEDVIRLVTELQEEEFSRRGISFKWLGGRRLQLIDIQNVFCEIDKYARLRFPEAIGLANRVKIKQRFKPSPAPVPQWYPPKWGINQNL